MSRAKNSEIKRGATFLSPVKLRRASRFQVRALRDKKGWTQARLGTELGMTQTNVSRLESPGYGRLNITTLQRIASVFDVALIVRFVPFSELIRWTNELSPEVMAPQSFEEELPQLERFGTAVVPQWNIGSSEPLIPTNVVALGHNRFTVQYRFRGNITQALWAHGPVVTSPVEVIPLESSTVVYFDESFAGATTVPAFLSPLNTGVLDYTSAPAN